MYALDVVIAMILIRVIIPVGSLLIVGEWANRRWGKRYSHR